MIREIRYDGQRNYLTVRADVGEGVFGYDFNTSKWQTEPSAAIKSEVRAVLKTVGKTIAAPKAKPKK